MVLGQIVALVMATKHMKFHKICFNTYNKVIAKVKVCHNDDDDNDYAAANADTRVMTIPRLFSLKNSRAKNEQKHGKLQAVTIGLLCP